MGVYTIAGGKGGVGKTTTVASIGVALHEAGESVAMVDADLSMANLAAILGVDHEEGIHQVLAGDRDLEDVLVETDEGIPVVPGDHGLDLVSEADPANLREVVEPLAAAHDVVLVDTGAGLDHETLVATGLADGTILTTTPHAESVADVAKTAEFVEHADARLLGAVVTRATEDTDLEAIAAELDTPIFGVVPEDATVTTEPATDGEAGQAYELLTAAVTAHERLETGVTAPAAVDWEPPVADDPATPAEPDAAIEPEAPAAPDSPAVATDGGETRETNGGLVATILSLFS